LLYVNEFLSFKMGGKPACMNAGIGASAAKRFNRLVKEQL
jgi:hypothetical protein